MNKQALLPLMLLLLATLPGNALQPTGKAQKPRRVEGGYVLGDNQLWRFVPNGKDSVMTQVSGCGANTFYDIHLSEYMTKENTRCLIACISFNPPYNTPTGYVIYEDGALFYRNDSTHRLGRRFYRITGPQMAPNETPTALRCHPLNPEKVWVASQTKNSPISQIRYSPDAGLHWINCSKGLPRKAPVLKLDYAADSFLYATTHTGIYRLNTRSLRSDTNSMAPSVMWTRTAKTTIPSSNP